MDANACAVGPESLPPELERMIFETTAVLYPKMAPTLLRVARRVLLWLEPLLYKVLFISTGVTKDAYGDALIRALAVKPASFFPKATHKICLSTLNIFGGPNQIPWSNAELAGLLRACTGTTDIYIQADIVDPPLLPLLANMQPTHVTMYANLSFADTDALLDFGAPFFACVTHLELLDINNFITADWSRWADVTHLPHLTHLAIFVKDIPALVHRWRPALARLKKRYEALALEELASLRDSRMLATFPHRQYLEEWAAGGDDMWKRADSFIAQKQRGEIEGPCLFYYRRENY
ncbi:hypothetical protein B0H10DRAFT_2065949 [Mycena sp. CBHHK59/15]|nr:hypothetical protein B0H10DRAFT_2065949 [Mycena sp. CBHHK59/15]